MGITGYYRRFIEGFSKLAYPITSLQKKGTKFKWTEKCQESFEKLKQLLTTTPILKVADPHKDFVVCTDASKEGLGGVLMQEGHVIAYESRKLKYHEENYALHDLEFTVIVHALKMWRHYLLGNKFLLKKDNVSLKHFFDQKHLNARKARCLDFLREFDFVIEHIKGKENKVEDALSRKINAISSSNIQSDLKQKIELAAEKDKEYKQIQENVKLIL
jgi:hypothetical protein